MKWIIVLLISISISAQKVYTFDQLLSYETISQRKQGKVYLTTQLVNSQDNTYFALLERVEGSRLQIFFEDRNTNKFARITLPLRKLNDGDEIRIPRGWLSRLRSKPKKKSGWVIHPGNDTLIEGEIYPSLYFAALDERKRSTKYSRQTIVLQSAGNEFKTNLWHEYPMDAWQTLEGLSNGLVMQIITYNPGGMLISRTTLKKQNSLDVRLIIE